MNTSTLQTDAPRWRHLALDTIEPQPWRNGGGLTRELVAWPQPQDWRWRLSVAQVDADGPFSVFDGVRRWFAVLEGAGVRLTMPAGPRVLRGSDAAFEFDGAEPVHCELLDGPTLDLNLMTRGVAARMRRLSGCLRLTVPEGRTVALYANRQHARIAWGEREWVAAPRSLIWCAWPTEAVLQLHAADALWMEIDA